MTRVALGTLLVVLVMLPTSAWAQSDPVSATTPRADGCGMTDANATYRDLHVGDVVTLQRHRWVRGEANWRDEMARYVGRAARVTQLSGVDGQGCPGVRVDADHEQYFWRVRDLGIGTDHQPPVASAGAGASAGAFPQGCGSGEFYGAARVGAQVVLGRHRMVDGDDNWADDMAAFVGRTARITDQAGADGSGCPGVHVDVDGGEWFWRIRDLRPVGGAGASDFTLTPSTGVSTDHGRPAVASGGGSGLFGGASGSGPGPQACGQREDSVRWEGLQVGAEVVLGRHRPVNGDDNWNDEMTQFVGRTAHVTELVGVDDQGCPLVRVDVDQGQWYWRARDLTLTGAVGAGAGAGAGAPTEEIALAAGFSPDPLVRSVSAGGTARGSSLGARGGSCSYAYYPSQPQLAFTLAAPIPGLLRAMTHASVDSAIAVRLPSGAVLCDDDGGDDLDAMLDLPGLAGRIEVFVGTWNREAAGSTVTFALTTHAGLTTSALP